MEHKAAWRIAFQWSEHANQFTQYLFRQYVCTGIRLVDAQPDHAVAVRFLTPVIHLFNLKVTNKRQVVGMADLRNFKISHLYAVLVQDKVEFLAR